MDSLILFLKLHNSTLLPGRGTVQHSQMMWLSPGRPVGEGRGTGEESQMKEEKLYQNQIF